MHFTKSAVLLAAVLSGAIARPEGHARREENTGNSNNGLTSWAKDVVTGAFSRVGFGARTPSWGEDVNYHGNVGLPYGSNMYPIGADDVRNRKYVVKFQGSETTLLYVVIWNKYNGDKMGFANYGCTKFTVPAGGSVYYAFDDDSQGGWTAHDTPDFPLSPEGFYATTWGEFDFGSGINSGWSAYDVSAIRAQLNNSPVRGMKICDLFSDAPCSSVTNAGAFDNSYSASLLKVNGIGGNLSPNPVRLEVQLDYNG